MSTGTEQAKQTLNLRIATTRGVHTFSFPKTAKVGDVIAQVRAHFELTGGGTFSLVRKEDNTELSPPDRPLVSFGLEDGEELILTGGGTNV